MNAETGSRKVILSTQGPSADRYWEVWNYSTKGIALFAMQTHGSELPTSAPGIWLLDPLTGHVRLVEGSHNWDMIGGGFAWRVDDASLVGGTLDKVYRLDLSTGKTISVYESKTHLGLFSRTAEGELLIVYGDEDRLALLDASRVLTPIDWPPEFDISYDAGAVDQPGIWITDTNGLALYMQGLGMRIMATNPEPEIRDSTYLYVAGDCR